MARFARRVLSTKKPTLYHLDVHVVDHCNLKCKGCEHYSSIADAMLCDIGVVSQDLSQLGDLFETIEHIWLLGGEPLMHPEIAQFIRVARAHFPHSEISVMTNGILVTRMNDEFWEAMTECDVRLLCDSYPINIDRDMIDELCKKHHVQLTWMPHTTEFFKIPLDVEGKADPEKSFRHCRNVSNCAIVRDGKMYPCAHVAYADIPAEKFNLPTILPGPHDSIDIFGGASGDDVIDFLMKPIPWCRHCDFDSYSTFEWSQSSGDASEWIKE